jgi:general secretion pathway protein A
LQTFLLGQPEFRKTLLSGDMEQLRQRVTATYHLGPMDLPETRSYIEHRLTTAGWAGDPSFDDAAFEAIYAYAEGIPRRINAVCDRLLLMGCLEQLHHFGEAEVGEVVSDIQQEFEAPIAAAMGSVDFISSERRTDESLRHLKSMDERLAILEDSVVSTLELVKQVVSLASVEHSAKDKS